jgi:hypothetical protein
MLPMSLQDELVEIRKSLEAAAPASSKAPRVESRLSKQFKQIGEQATPIRSPHLTAVDAIEERRDQFKADMEEMAESVAVAHRAEIEREEAMLRALETVASELEQANVSETQAAARERWMLRLTIASVLLAAVAAATGVLTQFGA